ncbi:LPS translocon maturation chaperone LptM [Variovorax ginsengisoli]|uniref:Small lipoprotein YifL n=1 Tax=Variovorax ginsengisoli TaxID=363844 RepID=A0ABT9S2D1_9BURK|nr:lipoprotein [Variovorax ginsengisoli]MDP9898511.1 putative small lipoprotein YifL [Variovorax ginsengisoli]
MLNVRQILVTAAGLTALGVGLSGCGLKGPLYLPTDPAAANRATLPSLMLPSLGKTETATPAAAPASPVPDTSSPAAAPVPAPASSAPARSGTNQ